LAGTDSLAIHNVLPVASPTPQSVEVRNNPSKGVPRRLSRLAVTRATGLLDMLYKPSELSAELQVPLRTVREWAKIGMPHQRDSRGRLWINGIEFGEWLQAKNTQRPHFKLAKDEAFCLRCRRRVKLVHPVISYRVKPPLLSGDCPLCGGKVNRGVKRDPSA
jgi:hypothetical protein